MNFLWIVFSLELSLSQSLTTHSSEWPWIYSIALNGLKNHHSPASVPLRSHAQLLIICLGIFYWVTQNVYKQHCFYFFIIYSFFWVGGGKLCIVVYTFNHKVRRQRQMHLFEFQASLVYIASSKMHHDTFSQKKKNIYRNSNYLISFKRLRLVPLALTYGSFNKSIYFL